MLRKRRRISESVDDDPRGGLNNLSDAMLVLALGFLIFAILALSVNPGMLEDANRLLRMFLLLIHFRKITPMPAVLKIVVTTK